MYFTFTGEPTEVIGIDENGYGPVIGPLVITAIKTLVKGDPWENLKLKNIKTPIKDSKEIFKHTLRAYKRGETIALALLNKVHKLPSSFYEYVELLTKRDISHLFKNCEALKDFCPDFKIPVWSNLEDILKLQLFDSPYIEISEVRQKIVQPYEFNERIKSLKSKALLDFIEFINLMEEISSDGSIGIFGKISGKVYYRKWFNFVGIQDFEVVVERGKKSKYRVGNKEINFLIDADSTFVNVAMASILGKYTRELFLYSLSRGLGFDGKLPVASGYRHDPKTRILKEALLKTGLPEECIFRIK